MKKTKADILITVWLALEIIIVVGFFVYSQIIGGSASLGCIEEDAYFVGDHGQYTQVSQVAYQASIIWEILFWLFIPLTPIGCFIISGIFEKADKRRIISE